MCVGRGGGERTTQNKYTNYMNKWHQQKCSVNPRLAVTELASTMPQGEEKEEVSNNLTAATDDCLQLLLTDSPQTSLHSSAFSDKE